MFGGRLNLIMSVVGVGRREKLMVRNYDVVGKIIINGEASTVS